MKSATDKKITPQAQQRSSAQHQDPEFVATFTYSFEDLTDWYLQQGVSRKVLEQVPTNDPSYR